MSPESVRACDISHKNMADQTNARDGRSQEEKGRRTVGVERVSLFAQTPRSLFIFRKATHLECAGRSVSARPRDASAWTIRCPRSPRPSPSPRRTGGAEPGMSRGLTPGEIGAPSGFYGERQRNFVGQHCWTWGYFVSTVGRDEATVRVYVRNQEAEDQRHDQFGLWR